MKNALGGIAAALSRLPAERNVERVNDSRVRMRCPNPSHRTRSAAEGGTPSFWVWTGGPRAGQGKCYGCGITPQWAEIVEMLGLPRSARFMTTDVVGDLVSDEEAEIMLGKRRAKKRWDSIPWPAERAWRGIPGALVQRLGGIVVPGRRYDPTILRLPALVRGVEVGHIDCALSKPANPADPAYINSSGPWAMSALYPYDHVRLQRPRVVAVVEGARDALTCIRNGLPAVATLGSTNWNRQCASLLYRINAELVVTITDPDDAGDLLKRSIYHDLGARCRLRSIELPCEIIREAGQPPRKVKLMDAADLSRRSLARVLHGVGVVKTSDGLWRVTK